MRQLRWFHYLPLAFAVFLILLPHPSLLLVFLEYYLRAQHRPILFVLCHAPTLLLSFLAFSSLIVTTVRDPGTPTDPDEPSRSLSDEPFHPKYWCTNCQAPKPERTHHCSFCKRCVLKMDHHCPWLANKCIGLRTYPAFIHFLTSVTLLATYTSAISIYLLYYFLYNPYNIRDSITFHALFLALFGAIFALSVGSFLAYHIYLLCTNQTTLESISQYHLLKYLPSTIPETPTEIPASPTSTSSSLDLPLSAISLDSLRQRVYHPPLEHEMSYKQRRILRDAHNKIRPYDLGLSQNVALGLGLNSKYWRWYHRFWHGGGVDGDGSRFPRGVNSKEQLLKLATLLYQARDR